MAEERFAEVGSNLCRSEEAWLRFLTVVHRKRVPIGISNTATLPTRLI